MDKLVIDDPQSFKDTEKYHSILAENEERTIRNVFSIEKINNYKDPTFAP